MIAFDASALLAFQIARELGMKVSPVGVARYYRNLITGFVLDRQDEELKISIAFDLGVRTLVTDTVMDTEEDRVRLAREVLEFAAQL